MERREGMVSNLNPITEISIASVFQSRNCILNVLLLLLFVFELFTLLWIILAPECPPTLLRTKGFVYKTLNRVNYVFCGLYMRTAYFHRFHTVSQSLTKLRTTVYTCQNARRFCVKSQN